MPLCRRTQTAPVNYLFYLIESFTDQTQLLLFWPNVANESGLFRFIHSETQQIRCQAVLGYLWERESMDLKISRFLSGEFGLWVFQLLNVSHSSVHKSK